jgi:hypothetical protein
LSALACGAIISTAHRAYWVGQEARHQALLNEPALPTQTLKIARARLDEARTLIGSIDVAAKGKAHGSTTKR